MSLTPFARFLHSSMRAPASIRHRTLSNVPFSPPTNVCISPPHPNSSASPSASQHILDAVLNELDTHGLASADAIVLTGESAGGGARCYGMR